VSSGSGSKPGGGVDVGVEREMVSVSVVGGADIVMVTVSVRSSDWRMNAGEWETGEIRRLSTAATNGGPMYGDDNVDGAHAGAASVDKTSANVNSGKMAIKAIERESELRAADYIVQNITRSWLVVLVEIELGRQVT